MTVLLNSSVRWRGLLGLVTVLFAAACLPAGASARLPAVHHLAYVTDGYWGLRSVPPEPGSVAVIDPATRQVLARVPVASRPDAVLVSPNGKRVYVAHEGSDTIEVIDTASHEVTATIRLMRGPPRRDRRYGDPDEIATPRALAVSPDGRRLYVAVGEQVTVLDTSTNAVVKTMEFKQFNYRGGTLGPAPVRPVGLTFSPDGKRLYVASDGDPNNRGRGSLTAIDVADNSVLSTTPIYYEALAVAAPMDSKAYVLTRAQESLRSGFRKGIEVVDTATGKLTGFIPGDYEDVDKIVLSPDHARAYVAGDNGLEVIDTATDRILRTVHFNSYIRSLAVNPDGHELYVVGKWDEVKVLDTATDRVLAPIPTRRDPSAVAFSPVAAPRVVTEPTNQSLVYGGEAHLFAQATGDPKPDVQWQVSRDGGGSWHDLAGATSPRHAFVPSGAQTGNEYRAKFTNPAGSIATRPETLTVARAVPTLEWQVPTPIEHGTLLSLAELNAEASVPGTFDYTPPAGTVLGVGAGQELSVTFTPRAGENYTSVTTSVPIDVTTAPEPPQPPPSPPPPAPVIPTPEPVGPTNPKPTPIPSSCSTASGQLTKTHLGPIALGMTRARAQQTIRQSHVLNRYTDNLCLAGGYGIRVGYATQAMTRSQQLATRLKDRIVFATSANPYYSLHGAQPGMRIAALPASRHVEPAIHIGPNTWYVATGHNLTEVIKARLGLVQEVGILNHQITTTRADQVRLLRYF